MWTRKLRPSPNSGYMLSAVLLCLVGITAGEYFTDYMRDATARHPTCSFILRPLEGVGAGHILFSRDAALADQSESSDDYRFTYTIVAPRSMYVLVRVNSVDIPMTSRHGGGGVASDVIPDGDCSRASLQIYDGNTISDVSRQLVGMCGCALPTETVFVSTSSELTLYYYQSADVGGAVPRSSFNLTFTYVATRKTGCLMREFRCRINSQCIDISLMCDGVDNCIDSSDESSDYDSCGKFRPSSNPFAGMIVAVSLILVFSLMLTIAVVKVRGHRSYNNANATRSIRRAAPSSESAAVMIRTNYDESLYNNDQSHDHVGRLFLLANLQREIGEDPVTSSSSADQSSSTQQHHVIDCRGRQGDAFQPLILVAGSSHVTVMAVTPPPAYPEQAAARCTPPPAYDSLFSQATAATTAISDDNSVEINSC